MKINLCKRKSRPRSALVETIAKIGRKKRGKFEKILFSALNLRFLAGRARVKFDDGILTYGVKFKVGFEPGGEQI